MHILQKLAKKSPLNKNCGPVGADYDFERGVWSRDGRLVALDPASQLTSKKNDVETGEDQKGQ